MWLTKQPWRPPVVGGADKLNKRVLQLSITYIVSQSPSDGLICSSRCVHSIVNSLINFARPMRRSTPVHSATNELVSIR